MFQLIGLLFGLPFYILYIAIKIGVYVFIFIISLISAVIEALAKSEKNKQNKDKIRNTLSSIENFSEIAPNEGTNEYNDTENYVNECSYDIENYYEKSSNYNKKEIEEPIVHKSEYKLTQITDIELKITIDKIQEIYKELGFYVKVINIIKEKYITEYEVIFPQEVTQADILSVSSKVIAEFQIDGVKIVRNMKKNNRIYIQIPLKYEEILT